MLPQNLPQTSLFFIHLLRHRSQRELCRHSWKSLNRLGHQVKAWWPNRRSKSQTLIQQFKITLPFLSVSLLKATDLLPFLSWLLQKHSADLSLVKRSWLFSLVLEILMEYSHVYPGGEADKYRVCCILAGAVKILLWTAVANWHSVDCWGHWISLP